MGAIPIVSHSAMDSLFDDLPVVITEDWSSVTEEFLEEKFSQIQQSTCNEAKIYMDYWIHLIQEVIDQDNAQHSLNKEYN